MNAGFTYTANEPIDTKQKTTQGVVFYGAVDGARTRDPRRDRPVL